MVRSKKRQAQLNFSSAPSSSPKASDLSETVQHRAAIVTYGSSPLKRKLDTQQGDEIPDAEPRSSRSSRSSKRNRRSQGKIDFSNHIGTQIAHSPPPTAKKGTKDKTANKVKPASGVFGKNPVIELSSSEDDDDSEDVVLTQKRKVPIGSQATPRRSRRKVSIANNAGGDDDDDDEVSAPRARASRKKQNYDEQGEDSGVDDGNGDVGEPETSGDEPMKSSPTLSRKRAARRPPRVASPGFIDDDEEIEAEDVQTPRRKLRKSIYEGEEVESPPDNEIIELNGSSAEEQDEDDDEDIVVSSQRRRVPTADRKKNKQETADLNEDLDFLTSSPPPASSGRLRSSAPSKSKNPRQKALEALKRKRLGVNTPESQDESTGDDLDLASDANGADEGNEDEEDAEEDFIVDEEDDTLGVPLQLPLQFSAQSRMKPKELFKYIVEWMVHKRINPAFEMNDEIYALAFNRLDDEVKGLAGSKYKSSVWTRDFTMALTARPKINIAELGSGGGFSLFNDDGCQACNRTSHPATFAISFSGKPYHLKSLENVGDEEDSDSALDDETGPVDSAGRSIPAEDRSWNVGKFCKNNAEIAHTLEHWRYHLNEWIVDYLDAEGHLTREKVFERDKWSIKKKRKYANRIVDAMEEGNEVKSLYNDFRSQVNAARENSNTYGRRR